MILHIVNKSPFDNNSLRDCLQHCSEQDSIILIEDAVFAASAASPFAEQLAQGSCYVLTADVQARGLAQRLQPGIEQVDDAGFIELTASHHSSTSWY